MTQNPCVQTLLEQGHEQLDRGKYQAALETFQQAAILEPQTSQVLYGLGLACCKLYEHHESVKYLDQALEIQKDYIPALAQRGLAYKQLNQNDDAKTDFERAIEIKPKDYEDWKGRSIALAELQQYEQALVSIDKAVKLKPDSHEAWMYHGITLGSLGRYEQALASINKAVKLKPDSHEAWMYHGIVLGSLGRYEEELASINKAVKLKPDSYEAWMYHGITLANMDRQGKERAIDSFDKAIELKDNFYEAWVHRGITLVTLKRFQEAVDSYDQAIELQPDYEKAWSERMKAIPGLIKLKSFEFVLASWERILKIKPENAEGWYYKAYTLCQLGQDKEAIISYDKAIEINPDYAEALKSKGFALKSLGLLREAIESYDKAIEIDPDDTEAWYGIGNAQEKLGYLEDAFDSYDEAVKIDRNCKKAWYNRSNVLLHLNRHLEALKSYEHMLTLDPEDYRALNGKGSTLAKLVRYPEAIEAYQESIYYSKKQYWRAWNNLGWAFINSVKSYKQALKKWTDGLNALKPETTDRYQEGCGVLHHSIGKVYYREGRKQGKREYWHKAKKNYEEALKFLENNSMLVEKYLLVLQDLYGIYLNLEEIEKAKELQRIGVDLLRRLLEKFKEYPSKQKQLALKFVGFNQLTVDLYAQSNQRVKALETAEEGKNACLTWLLSGWKESCPTPSWDKIQRLATSTTAVVYWHLSPAALTTFIIKHDTSEPILITTLPTNPEELPAPVRQLHEFEDWVKDWNQQYAEYRKGKKQQLATTNSWREQLPEMFTRLGKILDIPAILPQLNNISQLILIPHRDLHRFPLHPLFPDTFTITYLPSAQLGIDLLGREARIEGNLLSLEHPDSQGLDLLPYAEIESAAITQLFNNPTPKRIAGQEATKTAVKDALTSGYSIFHFTGHGIYDPKHPKQSALALSGEDFLTLEEICNINLSGYQLVSLSACETAITGNQTITEEYVGLVSAFLYQRVHYVISTLWTVNDDSTSLLMIYFYWQLKKGKSPAIALGKATKWLQNLTDRKLERLYRVIFAQLPQDDKPLRRFLRSKLDYQYPKMNLSQKKQKRFSDPYYWAAFTITGGYN
jgi:tetratricopeptide (TPR) repeat protein/CHAT domain-containing protein